MLNNPSSSITRSTHSQVSIREHSIPSGYLTTSASCGSHMGQQQQVLCAGPLALHGSGGGGCIGDHQMIYSQVNNNNMNGSMRRMTMGVGGGCGGGGGGHGGGEDVLEYTTTTTGRSMPTYHRQLNANTSTEFDNYSQVLSDDDDDEDGGCGGGGSGEYGLGDDEAMNYGDIDVTNQFSHIHHRHPLAHSHHNQHHHQHYDHRYQNIDADSLAYSLKTNTQHGSILASSSAAAAATGTAGHLYATPTNNAFQQPSSSSDHKNMYRAVEYKKGLF